MSTVQSTQVMDSTALMVAVIELGRTPGYEGHKEYTARRAELEQTWKELWLFYPHKNTFSHEQMEKMFSHVREQHPQYSYFELAASFEALVEMVKELKL